MTGFRASCARQTPTWRPLQVAGVLGIAAATLFACDGGPTDPPGSPDMIGVAGGTARSADGNATLLIPPGALTGPVGITIELAENAPGGSVGAVYRIGPAGTQFNQAALLTLRHEPGVDDHLAVATYENGDWIALPTTADPVARTLTTPVPHLSLFGIIGTGGDVVAACQALHVDVASARPGTSLLVHGVSPGLLADELEARILAVGMAEPLPVYIEHIDEDRATVIVPVHPTGRLAGGDAELVVFSGAIECPGIALAIESLPAAPGTLKHGVDALVAAFTQLGELLGYERETLLTTPPTELPGDVAAIAGGLQALSGAALDNSVHALLAGTAPGLDGVEPDLELMDAVLASLGFTAHVTELAAILTEVEPSAAHGGAASNFQSYADRIAADQAAHCSDARGHPFLADPTPIRLDREMETHRRARQMRTGAARAVNEGMGAGLATVGLLGGPGAAAVAGIASLTLAALNVALDMQAGLHPSELENIVLTAEARTFNGDSDPGDATGRGEWTAEISAWSTGYTLDWPSVLGAVPGLGKTSVILTKLARRAPLASEMTLKSTDYIYGLLNQIWGMAETSGPYTLEPCRFGPVVVNPGRGTERNYFDWRLLGADGAFGLTQDEKGYVVQGKGVSELRVETQPQRFLGQHRIAQADLEVQEIKVLVISAEGGAPPYILEPGESIDMVAQVLNAFDQNVTWSAPLGGSIPAGQWDPGLLPVGQTYTAPMEPGTYLVEAESASRRGLRASGEPPRIGSARVIVGGLRLSPRPVCVRVGETVDFSATIGGEPVDFSELEVVVTNGSITADGTFTSAGEGEVTIQARSREQPSLTDELTFSVAEFCAEWSVSVTGDYVFHGGGQCVQAWGVDPEDGAPPAFGGFGIDEEEIFLAVGVWGLWATVPLGEPGQPVELTGSLSSSITFNDDLVWVPPEGPVGTTFTLIVTWEPVDAPDGTVWAELRGSFSETYYRSVSLDEMAWITVTGHFSGVALNGEYHMSCW
jgi:hypothetical protein